MKAITFSREPAVYIGLLGALAVAVVHSGAVPQLTDNAAVLDTIIAALVGAAIRFFVSPKTTTPTA